MKPDFKALRSGILAHHNALIEAHLNKDVDFFVQYVSEDYLSVSHGEISTQTREEIKSQFTDYLSNTVFTEYKDLREPVIGFSDDGSMAWCIAQIKVKGKRTMDDGSERDLDFICAWISLYKRQDDKWICLGEVSSFK
ncbi:MAG: nuclear transport factor 2 family protein [Candidatus Odinarchaeota archaeon]